MMRLRLIKGLVPVADLIKKISSFFLLLSKVILQSITFYTRKLTSEKRKNSSLAKKKGFIGSGTGYQYSNNMSLR
jgi:hypothetical protein